MILSPFRYKLKTFESVRRFFCMDNDFLHRIKKLFIHDFPILDFKDA